MAGDSLQWGAGVADLSADRERLRVTGADRVSFLHGQCTNDIQKLVVGRSCAAAFLTAKGKMRGEGHVICLADALVLETSPGLRPSLEKFIITEDVTIEDMSGAWGEWLVLGGADARAQAGAMVFEHPLGVGVLSERPLVATIDAEEMEARRIEAGVPRWGVDMDENTIPNEAGLEKRAISYDKGCYIGQETIARIKTYGHVNRQLVQVGLGADVVPARGERIFAGEHEAGRVTSAVRSQRLGKPLVLGYVRRELARTGTKLRIGETNAEVIRVCGE